MTNLFHQNSVKNAVYAFSLACMFISPLWFLAFKNGMPTDAKYVVNLYFSRGQINHIDFLSAALVLIFLFCFIFAVCIFSERSRRTRLALTAINILAWIFLFDGIRRTTELFGLSDIVTFVRSHQVIVLISASVVLAGIVLARERARSVGRKLFLSMRMATLAIMPIMLVLLLNSLYAVWLLGGDGRGYTSSDPLFAPAPDAVSAEENNRIVVVLFDAWDHALTFERDDPSVKLPNLDLMQSISFQAWNARRFGGLTFRAIPAFLTGMDVPEAKAGEKQADLLLTFDNGTREYFSQTRTFFDLAYESGRVTGYAGTRHHPYCALFRDVIVKCRSVGSTHDNINEKRNIFSQIPYVIQNIIPFGIRIFGYIRQSYKYFHYQIDYFMREKNSAIATVSDPDLDFVYAHLLLPHTPFFYDRFSDRYTFPVCRADVDTVCEYERYFDQLVLMDRTLGEMIDSLKRSNLWEKTNLILLSDHPANAVPELTDPSDDRIPLLIKLANQTERVAYPHRFGAVKLFGLFEQILSGQVKTADDLVGYFDSVRE